MKRKTIELKEFDYDRLDILYDVQNRPFVIETTYGDISTVSLCWQTGRSDNYYFEGLGGIFHPSDIAFIEFIPEWGMI
ncbi:hypothetical protein ACQ46_gp197 [Citrobacter phage Moon]|uniref:Uncharacterized protein n=1 Tax=Citrobacter phage Moon TaxID=1540095 RepID=A0A0A0YR50_9CAUD|nr:hypothetical protein ACQ46_gp197 [Citrobacter phage Moon]AIX12227.1 hypothetical protein CPT_Moon256 [Citrobacter phage Moon]